MASFGSVQKIVFEAPKYLATRNVNYLTSRTYKLPSRFELLKQAASDRYHLNWFNDAWGKTKKTIIENWDSAKAATLKKNKKLVDDASKSGSSMVGELPKTWKTKTRVNKSEFSDDKKGASSVVEISKAKNKAQRELAQDWDAIRRANSKKNKKIVDDIKESATSTIEGISKSVKEQAGNAIDEATESIKAKIKEKGEKLKQKISK